MLTDGDQARFLKCIADPTRLRILKLLVGGDKYVGEIIQSLNREQSLVSHHLRALKDCNFITARQRAQKVYYRLADSRLAEMVSTIEAAMCQILAPLERSVFPPPENPGPPAVPDAHTGTP